jgi:hypothetical protein
LRRYLDLSQLSNANLRFGSPFCWDSAL